MELGSNIWAVAWVRVMVVTFWGVSVLGRSGAVLSYVSFCSDLATWRGRLQREVRLSSSWGSQNVGMGFNVQVYSMPRDLGTCHTHAAMQVKLGGTCPRGIGILGQVACSQRVISLKLRRTQQ
ncbi:hypothetical protein BD779DRAFT_1542996 [Infundibulicybe gibba]|nr:hypothetical protein BD779DRAFT_1542996 [Infundibulicybe gibba]